jgi:hypothetical protein
MLLPVQATVVGVGSRHALSCVVIGQEKVCGSTCSENRCRFLGAYKLNKSVLKHIAGYLKDRLMQI